MRRLRNRGPAPLTMLALFGGAIWLANRYRHDLRQAVQSGMGQARAQPRSGAAFAHDDGPVRQAGREEMRDPPRHWDLQDETVDESFPASDPPSSY